MVYVSSCTSGWFTQMCKLTRQTICPFVQTNLFNNFTSTPISALTHGRCANGRCVQMCTAICAHAHTNHQFFTRSAFRVSFWASCHLPQTFPATSHFDEAAVGWFQTRMLGVMYPERWGDTCSLTFNVLASMSHPGAQHHILITYFAFFFWSQVCHFHKI